MRSTVLKVLSGEEIVGGLKAGVSQQAFIAQPQPVRVFLRRALRRLLRRCTGAPEWHRRSRGVARFPCHRRNKRWGRRPGRGAGRGRMSRAQSPYASGGSGRIQGDREPPGSRVHHLQFAQRAHVPRPLMPPKGQQFEMRPEWSDFSIRRTCHGRNRGSRDRCIEHSHELTSRKGNREGDFWLGSPSPP